jgi:hypothetical protein
MDYDDRQRVKEQHDRVMGMVNDLRTHPAVLFWALGNELDFNNQAADFAYNPKVWNAVEDLAQAIHESDPHHPVMTVVGSITRKKIGEVRSHCPSLDLLGINEYGDLLKIPEWIREYGWEKPYAVTEWGPTGFWQVPKTSWGVPIEETSTEKARKYEQRYRDAILRDRDQCLGSYSFLWRQHQERTHTWFGLLDEEGRESEAVDVLRRLWGGSLPGAPAPQIADVTLDGRHAVDSVRLPPGTSALARVSVDCETGGWCARWEVLREGTHFPYGGGGEKRPETVWKSDLLAEQQECEIATPDESGPYRLFVTVYDQHNHFAAANIPFLVED